MYYMCYYYSTGSSCRALALFFNFKCGASATKQTAHIAIQIFVRAAGYDYEIESTARSNDSASDGRLYFVVK